MHTIESYFAKKTRRQRRHENGMEMASYFHIRMLPRHFHVVFDVASCLLNLSNRELGQETFLSARASARSKSRRYRWRMMASAVLVWNQQRQSFSFHVRDLKRERLTPSFAIYNDSVYFRLTSVLTKRRLLKLSIIIRKTRIFHHAASYIKTH